MVIHWLVGKTNTLLYYLHDTCRFPLLMNQTCELCCYPGSLCNGRHLLSAAFELSSVEKKFQKVLIVTIRYCWQNYHIIVYNPIGNLSDWKAKNLENDS